MEFLLLPVVDAEEVGAHADRPGLRRDVQSQRFLDLVEDFQRVPAFPVDLVDEGDDRNVAQAADFEQLARLGFYPLGGVDHHDGRVDGGQRAVGVFGKVLVARRVEQIVDDAVALERHHRRRDRDAAFLLDLHPVGTGAAALAAGAHLAGGADSAARQQKFFRQRRLTGIRVGDDRKRAPRQIGRAIHGGH